METRNQKLSDVHETAAFSEFRGRVRDLEMEVLNLSRLLGAMASRLREETTKRTQRDIPALLAEPSELFGINRPQIEERLAQARDLLDREPGLNEWYSGELVELENAWDEVAQNWPCDPDDCVDENELSLRIDRALEALGRAYDTACLIVVPGRTRRLMERLRPGQALDFHEAFAKEIPDQAQRATLLRRLYAYPRWIDGVVNVENGLILRASPNPWRRAWSWVLVIGLCLAGLSLCVWLGSDQTNQYLGQLRVTTEDAAGAPLDFSGLWLTYVLVVLGALFHLLLDAVKQIRARQGAGAPTLADWRLWVHVREAPLVGSVFTVWIGVAALLAFSSESLDWRAAFLVGYGLDSFADTFLDRLTKGLSTGVTKVHQQLVAASA